MFVYLFTYIISKMLIFSIWRSPQILTIQQTTTPSKHHTLQPPHPPNHHSYQPPHLSTTTPQPPHLNHHRRINVSWCWSASRRNERPSSCPTLPISTTKDPHHHPLPLNPPGENNGQFITMTIVSLLLMTLWDHNFDESNVDKTYVKTIN